MQSRVCTLATIYIDPEATVAGKGTSSRPYSSWEGVPIVAGNTYLQKAGTTYTGTILVAGATDASRPIAIGAYGSGDKPEIRGQVLLIDPKGVTVSGLEISGSAMAGITLQGNAQAVTVSGNDIHDNLVGVQLSGGTMTSVNLSGNTIRANDTQGINASDVSAASAGSVTISGNTLVQNGMQGVLLYANKVLVENNQIHNNGLSGMPGTSGIHVIAASASQNAGDDNVIRYNVVSNQHDTDAYDGNGIQIDHFADRNQVYGNTVFNNDGAGISVLDAVGTSVRDNLVYDDMLDSGSTHRHRGSIVVTGSMAHRGGASSTAISGNTIVSGEPGSAVLFVDAASLANGITVSGNKVGATEGTAYLTLGASAGLTVSEANALYAGGASLLTGAAAAALAPVPPQSSWLDTAYTPHSSAVHGVSADGTIVHFGTDVGEALVGGALADVLVGRGGNDVIDAGAGRDMLAGNAGDDAILAGADADMAWGGAGKDFIDGGAGDDLLDGGMGNDILSGQDGTDVLLGGLGDDLLDGGAGNDTLHGDDGNDRIIAGTGADTIYGDDGNDIITASDAAGDLVLGGAGDDIIFTGSGVDVVYGGDGADTLIGGGGADTFDGGAGADTINLENAASGQATIYGGDGDDAVFGSNWAETVRGGNGADTLLGGAGGDFLFGDADDDVVAAGPGNDILTGGAGADVLSGDDGADTLTGGLGADRLTGGVGTDRFDYTYGDGADVITDFSAGERIVLTRSGGLGPAGLQDLVISGTHDAVVRIGDGSITLLGVSATELDANDFWFV